PSKVEVKLSKEKELLELVENTVRRALLDLNLIPEVSQQSKEKQKVEQETLDFNDYKKEAIREAVSLYEQPQRKPFFKDRENDYKQEVKQTQESVTPRSEEHT